MSKHYFRTMHKGSEIEVLMGYDRPLGHVFMNVITTLSEVGKSHPKTIKRRIYSSIEDAEIGIECTDVNYFRRVLQRLFITVPESMFTEIMRDQNETIGNRFVLHTTDGMKEMDF